MRSRRPVASPKMPTCGVVLQRRLPGTDSVLSYKQAELDLLNLVLDGNQPEPFLFDGDTIRIREAEETLRKLSSWRL